MSAEIVIRPAKPSDCAVLAEMIRELAVYEKLEQEVSVDAAALSKTLFADNPRAFALLVESGGAPAAFCIYFYNYSTFLGRHGLYIEDIFVRDAYRRQGIGKRLFAELFAIAKLQDCGRVEWWVLDWNQDAIDFYRQLGAEAMKDWTVYRLTEAKFAALALLKAS